jgi:hypothetical protein
MVLLFTYLAFFKHSYSDQHPKRLWIHHLERDLAGIGSNSDSGLWITGFDGRGVSPVVNDLVGSTVLGRHDNVHYLRGGNLEKNFGKGNGFDCNMFSGDCYIYWPFYFPVSDALMSAVYIPQDPPVFSGKSIDESDKPFSLTAISDNSLPDNKRRISVVLTGPSHLTLIVRDNSNGLRIVQWGYGQSTEGISNTKFMNQDLPMSVPPPVRFEGIHYIQIGFGICKQQCVFRLEMIVDGNENVELSAYGHYVLMRDTNELKKLTSALPEWSVGAEWTFFVSKVIATYA